MKWTRVKLKFEIQREHLIAKQSDAVYVVKIGCVEKPIQE